MKGGRAEHPEEIEVVDSHTEGEPTRVVIGGWPELTAPTMEGRRIELAERFGPLWRGTILEPRGHDALVGALLTPPVSRGATAGVVFFDNAGVLWMCGHGTIGVVRTLEHLGRIRPGPLRLDTPAGPVGAELEADGTVTLENVPASLHARDVTVRLPNGAAFTGDVAYGGNWFFVCETHGETVAPANMERLREVTLAIQRALREAGVTGASGEVVDHVILLGPASRRDADRRNYVMCPGGAYDRSPCGTGTSATMAMLHGRGRLAPGQRWRQESITGSVFTGWLDVDERDGALRPRIQGRAYITGRSRLFFDPRDPFRSGLTLGS